MVRSLIIILIVFSLSFSTNVGRVIVHDGTETVKVTTDSSLQVAIIDSPFVSIKDTVYTRNVDTVFTKNVDTVVINTDAPAKIKIWNGTDSVQVDDSAIVAHVKFLNTGDTAQAFRFADNKLRTSSVPYTYDIAENKVPGHVAVRRFGHNDDVGTSFETCWHGSNIYVYILEEQQLKVVSSDTDDSTGDTGARTLFLNGLDGDYNLISQTISLTGTDTATSDSSFLRLLSAYCKAVGSSGCNEGIIRIHNNTGDTLLGLLTIGEGQLHNGMFTVPDADTLYIISVYGSEGATNKGTEFALFARKYVGAAYESWRYLRGFYVKDAYFEYHFNIPAIFYGKTDIEIRVRGIAIGASTAAGFAGWREE